MLLGKGDFFYAAQHMGKENVGWNSHKQLLYIGASEFQLNVAGNQYSVVNESIAYIDFGRISKMFIECLEHCMKMRNECILMYTKIEINPPTIWHMILHTCLITSKTNRDQR